MLSPQEQMEIIKGALAEGYKGPIYELIEQAIVKKHRQQQSQQSQQQTPQVGTPALGGKIPGDLPKSSTERNIIQPGQYKTGGFKYENGGNKIDSDGDLDKDFEFYEDTFEEKEGRESMSYNQFKKIYNKYGNDVASQYWRDSESGKYEHTFKTWADNPKREPVSWQTVGKMSAGNVEKYYELAYPDLKDREYHRNLNTHQLSVQDKQHKELGIGKYAVEDGSSDASGFNIKDNDEVLTNEVDYANLHDPEFTEEENEFYATPDTWDPAAKGTGHYYNPLNPAAAAGFAQEWNRYAPANKGGRVSGNYTFSDYWGGAEDKRTYKPSYRFGNDVRNVGENGANKVFYADKDGNPVGTHYTDGTPYTQRIIDWADGNNTLDKSIIDDGSQLKKDQEFGEEVLYKYVPLTVGAAAAVTAAPQIVSTLGAAGTSTYGAVAPIVTPYLTAPAVIGGTTIPGLTIGNIINAGFITHGGMNIGPDVIDFAKGPSVAGAVNIGIDMLELYGIRGTPKFQNRVPKTNTTKIKGDLKTKGEKPISTDVQAITNKNINRDLNIKSNTPINNNKITNNNTNIGEKIPIDKTHNIVPTAAERTITQEGVNTGIEFTKANMHNAENIRRLNLFSPEIRGAWQSNWNTGVKYQTYKTQVMEGNLASNTTLGQSGQVPYRWQHSPAASIDDIINAEMGKANSLHANRLIKNNEGKWLQLESNEVIPRFSQVNLQQNVRNYRSDLASLRYNKTYNHPNTSQSTKNAMELEIKGKYKQDVASTTSHEIHHSTGMPNQSGQSGNYLLQGDKSSSSYANQPAISFQEGIIDVTSIGGKSIPVYNGKYNFKTGTFDKHPITDKHTLTHVNRMANNKNTGSGYNRDLDYRASAEEVSADIIGFKSKFNLGLDKYPNISLKQAEEFMTKYRSYDPNGVVIYKDAAAFQNMFNKVPFSVVPPAIGAGIIGSNEANPNATSIPKSQKRGGYRSRSFR